MRLLAVGTSYRATGLVNWADCHVSPDIIGLQVITALRQMASELADGALLTIDPNRTRMRLLPLQLRSMDET